MNLRLEVDIIADALVTVWLALWFSVVALVLGVGTLWGADSAAEGLTRIVAVWAVILPTLGLWGFWRGLFRWPDVLLLMSTPLAAYATATILKLSVPIPPTDHVCTK